MMRFLFKPLFSALLAQLWVLALASAMLLAMGLWGFNRLDAPNASLQNSAYFDVEAGQNLRQITKNLAAQGLIADDPLYNLSALAYLRLKPTAVQAGSYEIPAQASFIDILALFASGKTAQYAVTIPEGLTAKAIVALLNSKEFLSGRINQPPAEGSLLSTTIFVHRNESRAAVISKLQALLAAQLKELWAKRASDLPYQNPQEALIMASIIQKESALLDEQPLIAGVFMNRLNQNWRLQADSTLVYWASDQSGVLGRGLLQSELDQDHPYNSYKNRGLPPGPIANVGLSALKAALNPSRHDYFYFVADGTGGHTFAKTLKEHNRNVQAWRKIEQEL